MTYGEAKARVLKLMDELKPKNDLLSKLPGFFDAGQKEVALYCPIWRTQEYDADTPRILPEDCLKPSAVLVDGQVVCSWPYGRSWELPETFTLRYQARPKTITESTSENEPLEVSEEAAQAVILYVAAKCQEMEHDQRFFGNFFSEYQGALANLSDRAEGVAYVIPSDIWI